MAFFKFRKNSPSRQDVPSTYGETAAPAETIESLRRRALYRLIGAAVLVLIAIIGFPMLFNTQPRPVAVQAPIIIPDRNAAPPLTLPASATAHSVSAPVLAASSQVPVAASLTTGEEMIASTNQETPASAPSAAVPSQVTQNAHTKQPVTQQQSSAKQPPTAKRAAEKRKTDDAAKRQRDQAADAARAQALLDGKDVAPSTSTSNAPARDANTHTQKGHYVIQIGAFATMQSAQTARQKAEHAGVKAYTESITTSAGQRTRVRVGPFASRDEAAQALAKLKQAGLTGSVLSPS